MTDLKSILQQRKFNVLLIGDNCIDKYVFGSVDRISPEAPVPILRIDKNREITRPGMAGNVRENLIALGNDVKFLFGKTSTKTRIVDIKTGYHLLRVDDDVLSDALNIDALPSQYDSIVISDYNKGFLTYDNIKRLREIYDGPIFIDTKKTELTQFEGCFVKINETELNSATSFLETTITTLGAMGAIYKGKIYETNHVEVHDVTGAGDVFLACLATFYLHLGTIEAAIPYANKLASISVTHKGTYTISENDLND